MSQPPLRRSPLWARATIIVILTIMVIAAILPLFTAG